MCARELESLAKANVEMCQRSYVVVQSFRNSGMKNEAHNNGPHYKVAKEIRKRPVTKLNNCEMSDEKSTFSIHDHEEICVLHR